MQLCTYIFPQYPPDAEFVLLGNGCDMESKREVTYDEGKQVHIYINVLSSLVAWLTTYSLQRNMAWLILRQVQKQATILMK